MVVVIVVGVVGVVVVVVNLMMAMMMVVIMGVQLSIRHCRGYARGASRRALFTGRPRRGRSHRREGYLFFFFLLIKSLP